MKVSLVIVAACCFWARSDQNVFNKGDLLSILSGDLFSTKTQLAYDFSYLNYCKAQSPSTELKEHSLKLEQVSFYMESPISCSKMCIVQNSAQDIEKFQQFMDNDYRISWNLDGLPSGYRLTFPQSEEKYSFYGKGFPLGTKLHGKYYINNHFHIIIQISKVTKTSASIIGFLVEPLSLNPRGSSVCSYYSFDEILDIQSRFIEKIGLPPETQIQSLYNNFAKDMLELSEAVEFSYSVTFENSNKEWANRWDVYAHGIENTDWLGIMNSVGLVIFLLLVTGHVFRNAVSKDIAACNERIDSFYGDWKELRNDIFRPPAFEKLFVACVANGSYAGALCIFLMILEIFCKLSMLIDEYKASLCLFLSALLCIVYGFVSGKLGRFYNIPLSFCYSLTAFLMLPILCWAVFIMLNFIKSYENSSGALDLLLILFRMSLWFFLAIPLNVIGSVLGYNYQKLHPACEIRKIPGSLPFKKNTIFAPAWCIAGALPFASILIVTACIMELFWKNFIIGSFLSFVLIGLILFAMVSCEVSILVTYGIIKENDYRWCWASFFVPSISGIYMLAYSCFFYFFQLEASGLAACAIYFSYMIFASFILGIVSGTLGFLSSFVFVTKIFTQIKHE